MPAVPAEDQVHDHAVRGRLNAGFFRVVGGYVEWLLRRQKQAVLHGLGPHVVEIGPGVGANLAHYPPGTELVAVEPNVHMHRLLRRRATAADVELALVASGAERIDLPDGSVDDVVSTLVLCTVDDPGQVIAEVARVLRPGGRFRFVEHVAAPPGTVTARVQRLVRRPWRWCFEGCEVDRHLGELIQAGPFRQVDLDRFWLTSPFVPTNTGVAGTAVR